MNSGFDEREAPLKQKIGYDKLLMAANAKRGVVVNWPDPRSFLPQAEQDWALVSDKAQFTDAAGLVERQIRFEKGEARLAVQLFVSSLGTEPVLRRLLDTMLATSARDPFKLGPADIGQLCLVLPAASPSVLVINHNVFLRLRVDDYNLDIVAIARAMTKFMNDHLAPVVADHVPNFGKPIIKPSHPLINEPFRIDIALPQAIDPEQLLWALSYAVDYDVVDQRAVGARHLILTVNRPGIADIPLWLADRSTLLSSESRIRVDVQPENKK